MRKGLNIADFKLKLNRTIVFKNKKLAWKLECFGICQFHLLQYKTSMWKEKQNT